MPALLTSSCPGDDVPRERLAGAFGNFPPTTYDKAIATLEAAGHGAPVGYINQSATAHPVTPRSLYSQRAVGLRREAHHVPSGSRNPVG